MIGYSSGCHTTFHYRLVLTWTKQKYEVLIGDVRLRVREIIGQVCAETGVAMIGGDSLEITSACSS